MNRDQLQGSWKQLRGRVREQWGRLTDDDLDVISGQREQLIGAIQRRYGLAKEEVQKQVEQWEGRIQYEFEEETPHTSASQQNGSGSGRKRSSGSGTQGSTGASGRSGPADSGDRDVGTGGGSTRDKQSGKGKDQQYPGSSRDREPSGQ